MSFDAEARAEVFVALSLCLVSARATLDRSFAFAAGRMAASPSAGTASRARRRS